jgi:hypothetical protein
MALFATPAFAVLEGSPSKFEANGGTEHFTVTNS